ncbi:hypothetical protein [Bradyrhizobium sp. USDA 10063]
MWILVDASVFAVGYVASIHSWPTVKVWINGVTAEAAALWSRAPALEAKIRAL